MEQVESVREEQEFVEKVPYFVNPLLYQLTEIGIGRAQSRITAGASQATRNPDLDGNDTPRSGMQSEVDIVQNAGQVPPDDDSSSSRGDSGDDDTKIQTDVVEE